MKSKYLVLLAMLTLPVQAMDRTDGWKTIEDSAVLFLNNEPVIQVVCDGLHNRTSAILYLTKSRNIVGLNNVVGQDGERIIGYSYNQSSITFGISDFVRPLFSKLENGDYRLSVSGKYDVTISSDGFYETVSPVLNRCEEYKAKMATVASKSEWFRAL